MDNIFLKVWYPDESKRAGKFPSLISSAPATNQQGKRFITNVTLEGDGKGSATGLWADSDILIADVVFMELGGPEKGIGECTECRSALISPGMAQVTVINARFDEPLDSTDDGSLYILATDGSEVLIKRSSFVPHGPVARLVVGPKSRIYSDDPDRVLLHNTDGVKVEFNDPETIPEDDSRFLDTSDEWLTELKKRLESGDTETESGAGDGVSAPVIVIVAICCAAVLVALIVTVLLLRRRSRKRAVGAGADKAALRTDTSWAPSARSLPHSFGGSHYGSQTAQSGLDGSIQSHGSNRFHKLATGGSSSPSLHTSTGASSSAAASGYPMPLSSMYVRSGTIEAPTITETIASAAPTTSPPPNSNAPVATKISYLHSQLNQFGKGDVLLGRFTLLGETQRRQGGQGVVAFAVGAVDRLEYAIKFFVVHSSYIAERQLYESQVLGSLLPKIEDVYDPTLSPSRLLDRHDRPLPPCIVMERGESLNEWSRRAKPDVFQAVAVMAHVATRLRDMHKAGFVHRDIKPSNIMLLPRENRWTVIDFGSAAEVGSVAGLSYTLVYAAPEVADAGAAGAKTIVADPAIDAWALGVVAFELLTGTSTFDMLHDGKPVVIAQLRGEQELPWEGERLRSRPHLRKRLGVFKNPVLALLHRDPVRRASMEDFCKACNSLFSGPNTSERPT